MSRVARGKVLGMRRTAQIDGDYRYWLDRHWGEDETSTSSLYLLMLNSSTADGLEDDPTIRRSAGALGSHENPVGPRNDEILVGCMDSFGDSFMVAALGADSFVVGCARNVYEIATVRNVGIKTWKKAKDGHP